MIPPLAPPPMDPTGLAPRLPTIRDNVARLLKANGITGIDVTEVEADRVFGFDVERSALVHCMRYRGILWHEDLRGIELRKFHGKSAIASFRELTTPSLQIVFHAISDLSPGRRDCYFVELDVDHAAPTDPVKLIVHGTEVLVNAFTRSKTDQVDMAQRIAKRLGPVEV